MAASTSASSVSWAFSAGSVMCTPHPEHIQNIGWRESSHHIWLAKGKDRHHTEVMTLIRYQLSLAEQRCAGACYLGTNQKVVGGCGSGQTAVNRKQQAEFQLLPCARVPPLEPMEAHMP